MSKSVMTRIVRLENAGGRQNDGILVATDDADAERLRATNPTALIIVTGVPRSSFRERGVR